MKPRVAVLICNWNRGHLMQRSLWLLSNQSYPCEIWIMDTGSTDLSKEIALQYGAIWHQVRHPTSPRAGPYDGWKFGYERADADFIILTHPEVMVPLTAIEQMIEGHGKSRSSSSAFCLPADCQQILDTVDWKKDLNQICTMTNFWPYRNYWGYTNYEAMAHYEIFMFTGQYRDQWDRFGFLPGDPDSDYFCGYEDWMVPEEIASGWRAVRMPYSVYHQYHSWDKPFGRAGMENEAMSNGRSVRIDRIRRSSLGLK